MSIGVSGVPVQDVVGKAKKGRSPGHIGDGKIFAYDVEKAVKIHIGEEEDAPLTGRRETRIL